MQRVDHVDAGLAQRFQEARCANARLFIKFQWIGESRVETAPQHADINRARNCAHLNAPVLNNEVFSLEQIQAEVAGDVGVFEVGVVPGAGRQDRDTPTFCTGQRVHRFPERAEKACQPVDIAARKGLGIDARRGTPVLQRKTSTRRRLCAVTEHQPRPIRTAADLKGQKMQKMTRSRCNSHHRSVPFGIARHQFGGQMTVAHERRIAVEVCHHAF